MKILSKHRGFVTLGIVGLSTAAAILVMLGAATGFALLCGSILGGAISIAISDIRATSDDDIDMREN